MPRYDLNIAIFDTIRYIVPSLFEIESDGQFDSRFDSNAKKMIHSSLMYFLYLIYTSSECHYRQRQNSLTYPQLELVHGRMSTKGYEKVILSPYTRKF